MSATATTLLDALIAREEAHAALDAARAAVDVALAAHFAAHSPTPPVDEADVEALAGLLVSVAPLINGDLALARRLLATGRVSVTR